MRARRSVSSMSGVAAQKASSVMTTVRASTAWARTPAWTSAAAMSSHESRSPLAAPQVDAAGAPISATQAHAQALAVLRQGITERKKVWVGFVDAHGTTGSRLVRPVSMGGGFLHAEDDRSQTRHTFALHRITAAALDS